MTPFIEQFHWLRPLWLWALVPALLMLVWLWRQSRQARQWHQLIAPELLPHLVDPSTQRKRRSYLWGLAAAWLIATIALAGPSWEQRPMPVFQDENALVIVLDLSPSMLAEDLNPSRLVRAQMKATDVLRNRTEGDTGLVAYAGDAHVVTPLTNDTETIQNLLRTLHPNIMPLPGSNVEDGVNRAKRMLQDAGLSEGQILLLTDGVVEEAVPVILEDLRDTDFRLSILGIGTTEGAPIPNERGGFERDRSGNIVVPRLEEDRLERLAGRTGGRYERIDRSADDVEWILAQPSLGEERHRQIEREFDTWYDRGHWLVLLLIPLVLYSFRRGLLAVVFCMPLLSLTPAPAQAMDWQAPWLTPQQRGERRLQEDPETAAELFDDPEWLGSALYRAGDYEAAARAFAQSDRERAHYNRGNALARAGALEEALEAYDQALARHPEMEDAIANRALVEQLLQQQQEQEQEGDDDAEGDDSQDQSDEQDGEQDPSEGDDSDGEDSQDERDQDEGDSEADPSSDDEQAGDEDEAEAEDQPTTPEEEEAAEDEPAPVDTLDDDDIGEEERQAMEQWLRQVPDDPGGLLRRKFQHESQQRRLERFQGQQAPPDADERW